MSDFETVRAALSRLEDGPDQDDAWEAIGRIEGETERLRAAIQEHQHNSLNARWTDREFIDRKLWAALEVPK